MILTCGCDVTTTDPARIVRACEQHGRISLRDHFAGLALAGSLAGTPGPHLTPSRLASECYAHADAMLMLTLRLGVSGNVDE